MLFNPAEWSLGSAIQSPIERRLRVIGRHLALKIKFVLDQPTASIRQKSRRRKEAHFLLHFC